MSNRFVLRKAVLPLQLNKKEQPTIDFTITNVGYAALYNPRRVKIIFRNIYTKKEYSISLKADPRRWFSGTHHIKENVQLPAGMGAGSFQLFLYLPDVSTTLANRAEYAVLLANENMADKTTGYNNLQHILRVK